jgi:hypothetical protein
MHERVAVTLLLVAMAALATAVACGIHNEVLDAYPDASTATSSGGASSSGASSSGAPAQPDADTSGSSDAGIVADGGVDPANAGPGGTTTSIACGTATCPLPEQKCCVSELTAGGSHSFACVLGAVDCPRAPDSVATVGLACSGAANCPDGTVCCAEVVNGNNVSSCQASCPTRSAQLCDPAASKSGCSPSDRCSNGAVGTLGLPRTFGTCINDNQQ